MNHSEFLRLLIKTGTGNIDLIKIGCTKMQIKMWKKGTASVPLHVQEYLQQRLKND